MTHFLFTNNHLFNMGAQDLKFAPKRHLNMMGTAVLTTAPNKTFTNPNFVNNLNKYQTHTVRSHSDGHCNTNNYKNSSLINSIKEHCPDIILAPNFCQEKREDTGNSMGFARTQNIDIKKERSHKRKQPRKNSRQNQSRQLINEIMDCESWESLPNSFEEDKPPSYRNKFDLNKIIIDKPLKKLISTVPIPLARNKDMVVTFISQSPPTRTHMSMFASVDSQNNETSKNGHRIYKEGRMASSFEGKNHKDNQKEYTSDVSYQGKNHDCQNYTNNCTLNTDYAADRSRFPSVCDSEDSFIVFEDDSYQNHKTADRKLSNRHRIPSICESEDSFIVFEGDNAEDSDYDQDLTDFEEESDAESDEESSFDLVEPKKVHFASAGKLCEVHPMVKWAYAYQAARKGPWEELARDRVRFKDRIRNTERKIGSAFDKSHREKVYKTRFEDS